jgi:glutathione S-transferase
MSLTLIIGNKNYSSWSMRPWVLLRQFDIPFAERMLKFDSQDWAAHIGELSPSRKVPVLWEGEPGHGLATWESLAIMERVAELHPELAIWPRAAADRSRARAMACEMISGFRDLRGAMPMNLRASHPGKGHTPAARADAARIQTLWAESLKASGGPFLFGEFSAADAMFAPVVTRFRTYAVPLDERIGEYSQAVLESRGVADWIADSRSETEFVAMDEPYALPPA